ncbi:sensor histidine kinase [Oceanispirochaeta sp.]|jgi:two-component system sensor histidine kinase YesM|uniref:cache domain-containing sensor histidine kinase n=1 Tax=Oceanispirochaeta sp. TaxID=2035350 RepID=UPI0026192390|nr:sensor histidine kinase [Oceanispirochaeta sp.]MDA3955146.1 sensor histidine kinase [Oceanispirochaeta sp.]
MKMGRVSRHFKISKLANRVLKYFSAFSIIPILLFGIPLCIYLLNNTVRGLRVDTVSMIEQVSTEMDLLLEDAYQIGNTISRNPLINEILSHTYDSPTEQYLDETILNSELTQMLQYTSNMIEVYIIAENGGLFKSADKMFIDSAFKEEEWYRNGRKQSRFSWYRPQSGSLVVETLPENHVPLLIPIRQVLNKEVLGLIVVDIRLPSHLNQSEEEKFSTLYLVDEEDTYVFEKTGISRYQEKDLLPELVRVSRPGIKYWDTAAGAGKINIKEGRSSITAYKRSTISDWIYCSTVSKKSLFKNLIIILVFSFFILLVLILISSLMAYRVSRSLTNPIIELSQTMALVRKGDFSARVHNSAEDEIGVLGRDFNKMIFDITKLMDKIYEEQNKLKQYELMLLQAQINPHFLYNTLDSIIWLIRMKESEDSIRMIQALTVFLRTGLSKGKDIISLQQEIENVTSYLTIQQLRYKNKLSYEIDLPDDIMTQPLPKLILQPLVENAIYHGIKNLQEGGFIHIYGYEEKKDVVIIISDNGAGMSPEQLEPLCGGDPVMDDQDDLSSYGFKNVKERLSLFFKDKCSLGIESQIGEGTKITLRIRGDL